MTKTVPDMPFAQVVREAAARLGEFDVPTLGDAMGVQTREELKRVRSAVGEFVSRGEVVLDHGRYRYAGRSGNPVAAPIADRMWRVVRGLNKCGDEVSIASVAQLSKADRHYCGEYLRRLARVGILRAKRTEGKKELVYVLAIDPGPKTPRIQSKRQLSKGRDGSGFGEWP